MISGGDKTMRLVRRKNTFRWEDDFIETELDMYSDEFDEEEAIARGWKPSEIAFSHGFRRA
jgi:hypothetical protein